MYRAKVQESSSSSHRRRCTLTTPSLKTRHDWRTQDAPRCGGSTSLTAKLLTRSEGTDLLAGNVPSICANLLDLVMLHGAKPPYVAAYNCEENKDNGEGAEDFVLPEVERLT